MPAINEENALKELWKRRKYCDEPFFHVNSLERITLNCFELPVEVGVGEYPEISQNAHHDEIAVKFQCWLTKKVRWPFTRYEQQLTSMKT